MKSQKFLLIIILFCVVCGVFSILVGTTFAFFTADIKGETVNEINSSSISLVFTESSEPSIIGILEDDYAMISDDYFEFSISSKTDSDASYEYYLYLSEEDENTIATDKVKLFLTDDNDLPIGDSFVTKNDDNGVYCYDYYNKKAYSESDEEYSKCQNINFNDNFYIMDTNYYGNIDDVDTYTCRMYEKTDVGVTNQIVDYSKCQYGDVYKAKPMLYTNLGINEELGLNNIIYKGVYKNIDGVSYYDDVKSDAKKSFRIRVWANELDSDLQEVEVSENEAQITSEKEYFKYKVNVYAKQIGLSK